MVEVAPLVGVLEGLMVECLMVDVLDTFHVRGAQGVLDVDDRTADSCVAGNLAEERVGMADTWPDSVETVGGCGLVVEPQLNYNSAVASMLSLPTLYY